ncbi:hypothetical protein D9M68_652960 [compost metagenome]
MTVNNVRRPSEFFYNLQRTLREEDHAFCIVIVELFISITVHKFSFEEIFVIHEIYLQSCIR